jgi:5-methylcytosine-specific restriction endonuclease McrA
MLKRNEAIPEDVKVFVWQRDGGRCVECGSREDLEYDHMILLRTVAHGRRGPARLRRSGRP